MPEECEQQVWLLLWRVWGHLRALPDTERDPFAMRCVERAVRRFLVCEGRRLATLHLEDLGEWDEPAGATGVEDPPGILHEVAEDPRLAEALSHLRFREEAILDLHYGEERTDAEIARLFHSTEPAVKMARTRALARLRALLEGGRRAGEQ